MQKPAQKIYHSVLIIGLSLSVMGIQTVAYAGAPMNAAQQAAAAAQAAKDQAEVDAIMQAEVAAGNQQQPAAVVATPIPTPTPAAPVQAPVVQAPPAPPAPAQNPQPAINEPAAFTAISPASKTPIFQSDALLLGVQLTAPFTDLMNSDRTIPEGQTQPSVQGTLTLPNGKSIAATFSLRGNSSKHPDQCTFAKLDVKFAKTDTAGSILDGLKKIKIGTHCGETDVPGPTWGRTLNQKEPVREALIYRILNLAGVVTLRSRIGIITYHDTSANSDTTYFPQGTTLVRNAMFLEDEDAGASRYYGATIVVKGGDESQTGFTDATTNNIDPLNVVLGVYAHALTDNLDWDIKMSPSDTTSTGLNVWNVNVIQTPGGKQMLVVYDWDIAGWVKTTGYPLDEFDPIQTAKTRLAANPGVTAAVVNRANQNFLNVRSQINQAIDQTFSGRLADSVGQTNAHQYVDQFFQFITSPVDWTAQ